MSGQTDKEWRLSEQARQAYPPAHDLALMGFRPVVYEIEPVAAGMLAVGVPDEHAIAAVRTHATGEGRER